MTDFKNILGGLDAVAKGIWDGVGRGIKDGINFLIGLVNGIMSGIDSVHVSIAGHDIGFNIPLIPKLATGGMVTSSGIVDVHAGERMFLPAGTAVAGAGSMLAAGGGQGRGHGGGYTYIDTVQFNITVAQKMTRAELDDIVDYAKKKLGKDWRGNANIQVATSGSVRS